MKIKKIPPCSECGEQFENIFEATDHLLEDDEPEFDPKLILPNGYTLMVGSLLRCLYGYADKPDQIKDITESTYATLYAAETNPGAMKAIVEDMVVAEHMHDIDTELFELLQEEADDDRD
jgi:hypothetical protein